MLEHFRKTFKCIFLSICNDELILDLFNQTWLYSKTRKFSPKRYYFDNFSPFSKVVDKNSKLV